MADTVRTLAALQTLLADNTSGDISAQDVRDFLVSAYPPSWIRELHRDPDAVSIDEFDDGALSGDWTTVTAGGAQTITEDKDLLSVKVTTAQGNFGTAINGILIADALSVGEAVEVAVVGAHTTDADNFLFGPLISDGTTTGANIACAGLQLQGGLSADIFGYLIDGTFSAPTQNGTAHGAAMTSAVYYVRIEYDASNSFKTWFSPDGVSWQNVQTASVTLTPSHVGFAWMAESVADMGAIVAIDYVRIVTV